MRTGVWAKTALFGPDNKVLLIRRSHKDDQRPGEWDFPGGNIEANEDIIAGELREIEEESGITLSPEDLKLIYAATQLHDDELSVTRLLFVGKTEDTAVKLSFEHEEFCWVDIDTALREFPHPFYGVGLKYARDNGLL